MRSHAISAIRTETPRREVIRERYGLPVVLQRLTDIVLGT